ncbi:hypothetical protein ACFQU2_23775 [Siccirubricoccus deserti]
MTLILRREGLLSQTLLPWAPERTGDDAGDEAPPLLDHPSAAARRWPRCGCRCASPGGSCGGRRRGWPPPSPG